MSSMTRLLSWEQRMPCQSHGAAGVEESQPSNAPSGSWSLILNAVRAWISDMVAHLKVVATKRKQRKIAVVNVVVDVAICIGSEKKI